MKAIILTSTGLLLLALACKKPYGSAKNVRGDNQSPKLEIEIYGKPAGEEKIYARSIVAAKWGLQYKYLGCVISPLKAFSVDHHNKKVGAIMAGKFGENWKTKLDSLVDKEYMAQNRVEALLNKQKQTIAKRKQMGADSVFMEYYLLPQRDSLVYQAYVNGWQEIKGKNHFLCYYKYMVDLKNSTVKLYSTSVTNVDYLIK